MLNPLNAELNPTCHLLALLGAHPILHISRIRVNVLRKIYTKMFFSCSCRSEFGAAGITSFPHLAEEGQQITVHV
jgi:hypothetical protein